MVNSTTRMHEIKAQLEEAETQIDKGFETIDIAELELDKKDLEIKAGAPDFWNDQENAKIISKKLADLQKLIGAWRSIKAECAELIDMTAGIHPEEDPDGAKDFRAMSEKFFEKWRKLNLATFLNGKYDRESAILSVHAGTGGKDAQDFSEMLLGMYLKYAENHDYTAQILDKSEGEEAGIKSATVAISGPYAYGYLKGENGVHRLIRLSPFNSGNTRETSFSLIEVLPELPEDDDIEIKEEDLRVDVYRSSGPGGQSVNTTDSAVRITHIPTGIVAACQNERSQLQNKARAMKLIKSKLVKLMEEKQAKELDELRGEKTEMSWGRQIRTYTLHPYQLVKDHRTGYEEKTPEKVLGEGAIDGFIEAMLEK